MMLLGSITKKFTNILGVVTLIYISYTKFTLILKVHNETRCGQIIDGSRDAHYKLLFDDSAFLFNQREKSFVVYTGRHTGRAGGLEPPTFQIGGAWPPHFAKKAIIYVGG